MSTPAAVGDLAAGLALLTAGGATWLRAQQSRTGPLLVLAGSTWLAGGAVDVLVLAHRGPLVHVLLTFPTGRTRSKLVLVVVAAAYVDGLVPAVARLPWPTIALMASVVGVAVWRWTETSGPQRRAHLVAARCAAAVAAPLTLASVSRLAGSESFSLAAWMYDAAIVVTAGALSVDLLASLSTRSAATGLVVDLGGRHEPRALRDALARTVGDPALEIAYRVGDEWVDEAGRHVALLESDEAQGRSVTLVEDGGAPVAAIVHDPAALRDRTLAQSVNAAVRLVLANVRLQAEDVARMREVEASRRRLVETGDEQRRRLREQLRGGAEQTLAAVARDLAVVANRHDETDAQLVALADELDAARADLARFAQGIHPRTLTGQGLAAALGELADQAALRVTVQAPARRFPAPQEAAAYFVCSEALANVSKYAEASAVSIEITEAGPTLVVRVVDDGRGGADPGRGTGLRGLADRVEALGGRLTVLSPSGRGTRVEAVLPTAGDTS